MNTVVGVVLTVTVFVLPSKLIALTVNVEPVTVAI
jgi:hypothetical protein